MNMLDNIVNKLPGQKLVKSLANNASIKNFLNSKLITDLNKALKDYLDTLFMIVGLVLVVGGVVMLIKTIKAIFSYIEYMSFYGVDTFIHTIVLIVFYLCIAVWGIGLMRLKAWSAYMGLLTFALWIVSLLYIVIMFSGYFSIYITHWVTVLEIVWLIVLNIFVLKNPDILKK